MKKIIALFGLAALPLFGFAEKYEPTWESLAQHEEAPEWFQDSKLGIYFHWGVYSVAEYMDEWYPRYIHFDGHPANEYHKKTYGELNEFGYHDFVPMFKAEHFDAAEWAKLFKESGAKFAGPVAEHHDGFAMWASKCTPWNSMDMGPKVDVLGELTKEIRKQDMRVIATFHHARNLQRYSDPEQYKKEIEAQPDPNNIYRRFSGSHYPYFENMPPRTTDDELKYLYGNIPEDEWLEEVWLGKLVEVIDNYQPDIIWFDSWLDRIPEEYRQKFCAYYLNAAEKWDREVVIVRKQDDLPLSVSVDDLEKSRKADINPVSWMTDETISRGSWSYVKDLQFKSPQEVVHILTDVVSKNGVMLLNISPRHDGIIPDNQQQTLLELGEWLKINGEAIYETRPWYTAGEGPTLQPEGHFKNHEAFNKLTYTNQDIRYTTNGKVIYATILGEPEVGSTYTLESFAASQLPQKLSIKRVSLLGSDVQVSWKYTDAGLAITIPNAEYDKAVVFKVETK